MSTIPSRVLTTGAHTGIRLTVGTIMAQVMLAIAPATAWGLFCFGWPALNLFVITLLSALMFEALCLRIAGKAVKVTLFDGSALLTGWLVAMTLPPWAPWWIGVVGAGIAIILGKQVYGGLGQNLFNPAMLARVALLISFPVEMTTWANLSPIFSEQSPSFAEGLQITFSGLESFGTTDAWTGATTLGYVKTEFSQNRLLPDILQDYSDWKNFFGWVRGSLGETSSLLLLIGGIWLIKKDIIQWHIPVSLLATVALLATAFQISDSQHYLGPFAHLNSGALICVAFFIATDYVTSPNTAVGKLIFGAGCGLLVYIIRTWGAYPEGTGFAVLLMNCATPLIDHYIRPRIYGRDRKGKPLELKTPPGPKP